MKPDQKKATTPADLNNSEREREREGASEREREREREAKLETMHHPHRVSSSLLWRTRLSRKSLVTSDLTRARKSNNPTSTKNRTFFYFLIPYQHVYTNLVIWTFYLFVFNIIVKIFSCLRILCFWNCVFVLSLQPYADITVVDEYQLIIICHKSVLSKFHDDSFLRINNVYSCYWYIFLVSSIGEVLKRNGANDLPFYSLFIFLLLWHCKPVIKM